MARVEVRDGEDGPGRDTRAFAPYEGPLILDTFARIATTSFPGTLYYPWERGWYGYPLQ